MHACAALLENRRHYNPGGKFSNSETKLLYTLHWIILDAASECEDTSTVQDTSDIAKPPAGSVQLHTLKSIQLFVYLFAPLVNTLEDSDFQSLKLENGLRIWQPMWDYQQPDTPCFSTPVKPQRNILKAQRNLLKVNTNAANIYIGKGTSREDLNLMLGLGYDNASIHSSGESSPSPTRLAPLARLSDSEFCFMSQSAHSETQSVSFVCEFCNAVRSNRSGEAPNICKCGRKDSFVTIGPDTKQGLLDRLGSLDKDFMRTRLASAVTSGIKGPTAPDILSASYFDVAVLQCLFCLQWSDDGVLWALRYVHHRLLEICDEYAHMDLADRERSQSLPFADPKILRSNSVPKSSIHKANKEANLASRSAENIKPKPASMSPGLSTIASDSEPSSNPASPISQPFLSGLRKEPPFKKVCMVELRQYPDSTRAVVTRKNPPRNETSPTHIIPFKTKLDQYALPTVERDASSGLYKWNFEPGRSPSETSAKSPSDKGVKMELSWASSTERSVSPVTKFNFPPPSDQEYETSSHSSNDSSVSSQFMDSSQSAKNSTVTRPIITITQETPQRTQQNWPSRYAYVRDQSPGPGEGDRGHPALSRSMTDSNITYQPEEEVHEAPGAVHYIQRNGRLNYKVILQVCFFF